jgi:hypothetical protein
VPLDARDLDAVRSRTPSAAEPLDDGGGVGVLARQQVRIGVQHRDVGAEADGNACAISQPIGPPPIRREAARQLGQPEDRLVGEVVDVGEARDRGSRPRAPVATTARENSSVRPSTSTVVGLVNRPSPR